jgi:hypothetical protein
MPPGFNQNNHVKREIFSSAQSQNSYIYEIRGIALPAAPIAAGNSGFQRLLNLIPSRLFYVHKIKAWRFTMSNEKYAERKKIEAIIRNRV